MSSNIDSDWDRIGSSSAMAYVSFRYLMFAFGCTTFCTRILFFLVTYQVATRYPSQPLYLGYLGLVQAIPALSLAILGGHVADRFNRKLLLMGTISIQIACGLGLFATSLVSNEWMLVGVYGNVFFLGVARGFAEPALPGLEAQIVPERAVVSAATWSTLIWHVIAVIAPVITGYIVLHAGLGTAYLVSAAFGVAAWMALALIRGILTVSPKHDESILESLSAGWKFVASKQILWAAMSLDLFAVLFGGAVALLPLFASDILGVGAVGLGYLNAAPYLGASVMAMVCMRYPPHAYAGKKLLVAVFGFGISMIVFALSTHFYLSCAALFLSGLLDGLSVVIRKSILRLYSPDHMRGRVAAVSSIFIGASNELGELESGVAAHFLGLTRSVCLGGIVTLLIVLGVGIFGRELREFTMRKQQSHKP
jgi:MFS family permease